jgi:hypothetical protein
MRTVINEEVEVVAVFSKGRKALVPKKVRWQGKVYDITECGVWNPRRKGREFHHFITAATNAICFYLDVNAETMRWTLLETSDGLAD